MADPRICVTTWFDTSFEDIGNLCRTSLEAYGKRHGYDVSITKGIAAGRPASWNKIPTILSLFNKGYDFVLWVDADAVITNYKVPVTSIIQQGKDLYMAPLCLAGGGCMPNFGIFLLRNCLWSRDLLNSLWNMERYTNHPWWENAALIDHGGIASYLPENEQRAMPPHTLAKNPDAEFLLHTEWIGAEWNCVPRNDLIITNPPIICHYPAASRAIRLWQMSRELRRHTLISTPMAFWYAANALPQRITMLCHATWTKMRRKRTISP